jgi:4-hydroxy-tetrahydrodipicolinate synthase
MRLIRNPAFTPRGPSNGPAGALGGLHGSIVAMVTPFRGGQVDRAALVALCERQIKRGTAALVMCGSTGEGAALTPSEQVDAIAAARGVANGSVPVVAGCGAMATEAAARLAVAASKHGASALLCAPPPYSKPTQKGVIAHVRAIGRAADLPVILYDVPCRTGIAIADETVARLFESGLIVAIKDASGDLSRPPRLRALCGAGLGQFSGDDATAAAHRAMGGSGCVSVTANLTPALSTRMHAAWEAADMDEFARLRDLLSPVHEALFNESNPIPVKAALSLAGLCEAELRLPLTQAVRSTIDRLAPLLPSLLVAEDEAAGLPRLSLVM